MLLLLQLICMCPLYQPIINLPANVTPLSDLPSSSFLLSTFGHSGRLADCPKVPELQGRHPNTSQEILQLPHETEPTNL